VSDSGNQILQDVSGQRKLREDDQVSALPFGIHDDGQVLVQISPDIAKFRIDLGKGKFELHRSNLTTLIWSLNPVNSQSCHAREGCGALRRRQG
jgi:hypothetical protein